MFIKDFLTDVCNKDLLYYWSKNSKHLDLFYKLLPIITRLIGPASDCLRQEAKTGIYKNDLIELEDYIASIVEQRASIPLYDYNRDVLTKFICKFGLDITDYLYSNQKGYMTFKPEVDLSRGFYIVGDEGYFECDSVVVKTDKNHKGDNPFNAARRGLDSGMLFLTDNSFYSEYLELLPQLVNDYIYGVSDEGSLLDILLTYRGQDFADSDEYHRNKDLWDEVEKAVINIAETVMETLTLNGIFVRKNVIVKYQPKTKATLECKSNFTIADLMYVTSVVNNMEDFIENDDD